MDGNAITFVFLFFLKKGNMQNANEEAIIYHPKEREDEFHKRAIWVFTPSNIYSDARCRKMMIGEGTFLRCLAGQVPFVRRSQSIIKPG